MSAPAIEMIAVCSARPRASTQSAKGHQWWRRDVYHLQRQGDPSHTRCGRDCSEWLVIGSLEEVTDGCCQTCLGAYAPGVVR